MEGRRDDGTTERRNDGMTGGWHDGIAAVGLRWGAVLPPLPGAGKGRATVVPWALLVILAGCSSRPPPDFAPDPGLLAHITGLRVTASPEVACPGETIHSEYWALLDDGTALPFATRYDQDEPPDLHMVFLRRWSREALARDDGSWDTHADPLLSVISGFSLRTVMRDKPSIADTTEIVPEYSCLPRSFLFEGAPGRRGVAGAPGPDVVVRLGLVSSPFYERLLVAEIKPGAAPPFYVFADADVVPPADWLVIESQGGVGGRGRDGQNGAKGAAGQNGCPAGAGGAGGAGSNGGPGGPGGPGGRITIIVPTELPYLAGMVHAFSAGGRGGPGGKGGEGGEGGGGGRGRTPEGATCADGPAGQKGPDGAAGSAGSQGAPGPRPQVLSVPLGELFGPHVPLPIRELMEYTEKRN